MMPVSVRRSIMALSDQEKAEARKIGDDNEGYEENGQKWQGSNTETEDGLLESKAGNEEIHPYGWSGVTDLKVGEEDDPKVQEVDVITLG
jgi:hypothetical protein